MNRRPSTTRPSPRLAPSSRASRSAGPRQAASLLPHAGALLVALFLVTGCSTTRPRVDAPTPSRPLEPQLRDLARDTLAHSQPPACRAVHRAILTVRGRQYVCDGVLRLSPASGAHLAVVSPLGLVADIRARHGQPIEILRPSPLFQTNWTRDYLGRDLQRLFQPPPAFAADGSLPDGRVFLETVPDPNGLRARYLLNPAGDRWEGLELLRGNRTVYQATLGSHRAFPGWPHPVPTRIQVNTRSYQLDLRVADLQVLTPSP